MRKSSNADLWICPECRKEFRNKNQWHSCYSVDVSAHLKNKSEHIKKATHYLLNAIEKFGDVSINSVKSSIQVRAGATFLTIRPKKNHIELEFQLGKEINEFPVNRAIRISGNRVLHFISIDTIDDIDKQLLKWLKESYLLVKGTN